jgi:hypothetical protein
MSVPGLGRGLPVLDWLTYLNTRLRRPGPGLSRGPPRTRSSWRWPGARLKRQQIHRPVPPASCLGLGTLSTASLIRPPSGCKYRPYEDAVPWRGGRRG